MKVFLSGYMGSGKSLVAHHLAHKLDYSHIDLDDQIALMEGKSIPEIFNQKGELYFRKLETEVLKDTLNDPASLIVALGGGTPCYGNNLQLIKGHPTSKIVYLKAPVEFLTHRLFSEKDTRPVISHLKQKEDLEDFIRKHLFERSHYYLQADFIVNVVGKSPDEIAESIITTL
ncbi:shikimate kinase [soil metagenome]